MDKARGPMSLGRAMAWFAAAYAAAIAGYLGLSAAAGRLLGPESFGYFVVALTLALVAGQLGLMGVHRSGLREASRLEETTSSVSPSCVAACGQSSWSLSHSPAS